MTVCLPQCTSFGNGNICFPRENFREQVSTNRVLRGNTNLRDQRGACELLHQHTKFPCGLCGHLYPKEMRLMHIHTGTVSPALISQQ